MTIFSQTTMFFLSLFWAFTTQIAGAKYFAHKSKPTRNETDKTRYFVPRANVIKNLRVAKLLYTEIKHSDWLELDIVLGIANKSALCQSSYAALKIVYDISS